MSAYADSSFLVSLYGAYPALHPAAETMRGFKGDLLISSLSELEVVNAFALQVFRRQVLPAEAESSLRDFQADVHSGVFHLRTLTEQVFQRAQLLSRQTTAQFGTRTADLLHVAAALEFGTEYLFSFDERQRALAHAVQLKLN